MSRRELVISIPSSMSKAFAINVDFFHEFLVVSFFLRVALCLIWRLIFVCYSVSWVFKSTAFSQNFLSCIWYNVFFCVSWSYEQSYVMSLPSFIWLDVIWHPDSVICLRCYCSFDFSMEKFLDFYVRYGWFHDLAFFGYQAAIIYRHRLV